ncbi:hypothetical protein ACSDR0_48780 [Streptosporangium sp. G11]
MHPGSRHHQGEWRGMVDVNLLGLMWTIHAAGELLIRLTEQV